MDPIIVAFAAGLAVGGAAVWLVLRRRVADAYERGSAATEPERAALVERVDARDAEIARLAREVAGLAAEQQAGQAALRAETEKRASGEALEANNQVLLDLAAQALGRFQQGAQGELEKRQRAIAELVAPVRQSLVASLGARVLVSARRFKELQAVPDGREIAAVEQVEALPRSLQLVEPEEQPA